MPTKTTPAPRENGKPVPTGRKPSPKLLATALGKKLLLLDRKQSRLLANPDYSSTEYDKLNFEMAVAIKEAKKAGLNLISVQVADGSALYYEIKRTTKLITFAWLNTGGDLYVSDFGKVVSVPLSTGQKLIKQFKPNNL